VWLYTSRRVVVRDPLRGSGATAGAAVRTDRHFLGSATARGSVEPAKQRVADERARLEAERQAGTAPPRVVLPARPPKPATFDEGLAAGERLAELAERLLAEAGFTGITDRFTLPHGLDLALRADDPHGRRWYVELVGALTTPRVGLRRTDLVWRTLGRAALFSQVAAPDERFLVLTPELPGPRSAAGKAWAAGAAGLVDGTVDVLAPSALDELRALARTP